MNFAKKYLFTLSSLLLLSACAPSSSSSTFVGGSQVCAGPNANFIPSNFATNGSYTSNTMPVTVGNPADTYVNEPTVSVTICSPSDPNNCQTINHILLDTGSYGLRIFASQISVPLWPITNGASTLAECVAFGDGSSEWGQVQYAYVQIAGEPKVAIPIHTINFNYGVAPGPCSAQQSIPDVGPASSGFNGILGVGLGAADCGAECAQDAANEQYYTCTNGNCACGATVELAAQVQNPVSVLPTDNNGVILSLPAVAATGAANVSGSLYLGIGTRTNNTVASSLSTYLTDDYGEITTKFSNYSTSYMTSFLDSGSNMLDFPMPKDGSVVNCGNYNSNVAGFLCPAGNSTTPASYSAINQSAEGVTGTVNFSIGNAYSLLQSNGTYAFNNLGYINSGSPSFDWGLPFFYGRNVYVGIVGTSSSLGTGPYWAY